MPGRLLAVAVRERTAALVWRNARLLEVELPEAAEFEKIAATVLVRQTMASLQARSLFQALGSNVIPLKGLYLAEHLYPEPGLRDMGDLDVLIPRGEVSRADKILRGLGWHPQEDPSGLLASGGHFRNSLVYQGRGFPVHLHWHLVNASLPLFMYSAKIRLDDLWQASTEIRVAGAAVRAMAPHHLFIALCEHGLKHSYETIIHLVDLALLWPRVYPDLLIGTARAWGLESAVNRGPAAVSSDCRSNGVVKRRLHLLREAAPPPTNRCGRERAARRIAAWTLPFADGPHVHHVHLRHRA